MCYLIALRNLETLIELGEEIFKNLDCNLCEIIILTKLRF